MAQTKRKRRTKHRGNAAGTIEARGRTGPEPTWGGAAMRAGFASLMLFALFQLGVAGQEQTLASSLVLALGAFLLYVPFGYKIDRIFWERRMRKAGRPVPKKSKG